MKNYFWTNIFKLKKQKTIIEILNDIELFNQLNKIELLKLSKFLHHRTYEKDELIFSDKSSGECMYIIKSGSINIWEQSQNKKTTIAQFSDCSFFGESALLSEAKRNANATATTNSSIYVFFRADLEHLIERSPKLGAKISIALANVFLKRLVLSTQKNNHVD